LTKAFMFDTSGPGVECTPVKCIHKIIKRTLISYMTSNDFHINPRVETLRIYDSAVVHLESKIDRDLTRRFLYHIYHTNIKTIINDTTFYSPLYALKQTLTMPASNGLRRVISRPFDHYRYLDLIKDKIHDIPYNVSCDASHQDDDTICGCYFSVDFWFYYRYNFNAESSLESMKFNFNGRIGLSPYYVTKLIPKVVKLIHLLEKNNLPPSLIGSLVRDYIDSA
jgi:hypothetical protein